MNRSLQISITGGLALTLIELCSCGGAPPSNQVATVLKSSDLIAGTTISNLSGAVDSIFLPATGSGSCGLRWHAKSQSGDVGIAGRTFQAFSLKTPEEWGASDTGEPCSSGRALQAGLLLHYLDIEWDIDGVTKTVRVAMGDYGPYKKGDLLIKSGNTFSWAKPDGSALVAETGTRPSPPAQLTAVKNAAVYTNPSGTRSLMALIKLKIQDSSKTAQSVDLTTSMTKITVDLDLSDVGVSAGDTSTDGKILSSFSANFLSDVGNGSMKATITITP